MTYHIENIERDRMEARFAELAGLGWVLHSAHLLPSQLSGDNPVFVTIWTQ